METQVVTQERPQPLEPKLRLYLLKSYLVQRWQCGIKQGEERDCSSKRIVDVVYDFSFFFLLLLDTPQSKAVLEHTEQAVPSPFKAKSSCVFMKLEIQPAQRPREAMQPGHPSPGMRPDRGVCPDIPARDTRAGTGSTAKSRISTGKLRFLKTHLPTLEVKKQDSRER